MPAIEKVKIIHILEHMWTETACHGTERTTIFYKSIK
jgi:hypothetical protein